MAFSADFQKKTASSIEEVLHHDKQEVGRPGQRQPRTPEELCHLMIYLLKKMEQRNARRHAEILAHIADRDCEFWK